jgi:MFS family permease
MMISIPAGRLADRVSRPSIFLSGYAVLIAVYLVLLSLDRIDNFTLLVCVLLHGTFYAATEGVLMAMASAVIPAGRRTSGLAIVATAIGLAKLLASVTFGWLWQTAGVHTAVAAFMAALTAAIVGSLLWLRATSDDR